MQTLNGDQVVQLLRWRKNNSGGGYPEGDIGRIRTQQEFLQALFDQMLQLENVTKIRSICSSIFNNVETDFKLGELIWLAMEGLKLDSSDFGADILPGYDQMVSGLSFYIPSEEGILELVNESYNPYLGEITDLNIVPSGSTTSSSDDDDDDDDRTSGGSTAGGSSSSGGSSSGSTSSSGRRPSSSGSQGSTGGQTVTEPEPETPAEPEPETPSQPETPSEPEPETPAQPETPVTEPETPSGPTDPET